MRMFHLAEATRHARDVDLVFFGLLGLATAIVVLIFALIVGFSIVYRKGSNARRGRLPKLIANEVELGWTAATLFIFLFLFWWAASLQLSQTSPPADALEIHVVAKQWMWKVQHPSGVREINTLHVPAGLPVKLVMSSQDVIHSFYVPAFRVKQDVVPGRYTQLWFKAEEPGTYRLFCAEFCGLDHARMTGQVVVMRQADYVRWASARAPARDLASQGQTVFVQAGCGGCHGQGSAVRAPTLQNVYGRRVPLADGGFVTADEAYLRDSILLPRRQVVAGYAPVMPSFQGALDEEQLVALVAYLKSLKGDGS